MSENDAASAAPDGSGPSGFRRAARTDVHRSHGPLVDAVLHGDGSDGHGSDDHGSTGPDGADGPSGRPAGPGGVRWAEGTGREYDTQPGAQSTGGASPYSAPTQVTQQPQGLGSPPGATAAFGPMPSYPATAPQTREAPVGTYDGPGATADRGAAGGRPGRRTGRLRRPRAGPADRSGWLRLGRHGRGARHPARRAPP